MAATPPARRRRLGAEERREQIVAATVRVLADGGYQAASADAIAREAGVSKGLLWHYFGNQDDLMAETARRTLVMLRRAVGEKIDLDAPAPEVVRAAIRAAADLVESHGRERRAINEIVFNLREPDGGPRMTMREYDEMYDSQEELFFRRGQDDGDFDPKMQPRMMAVTYQGAVDSMLAYLDAHPDTDADEFATTVADILLSGIRRTD